MMRSLRTLPNLNLPSPLARLRRTPFWAQALALCALFAIAGVAVVDDYGITEDEYIQPGIVRANAEYIATGDISGLSQDVDFARRYYGVAFEMPLLLAERAPGLQDSRHIYLMRHIVTHLFFISGGFACGMIAYRTLGNRWVALLAMLMFLLHPRLYAHSFFNSKDIPFAAMLAVALYLTHRAFRRDTLGAFLMCGVGVGLAINLRVFGVMLLPMILAMRGLDLWQAGRGERGRILMTGVAFLAAAIAVVYIIHPYYWENPLRFVEGLRVLSQHPNILDNLFMGEWYRSDALPWIYIPVWFAITAPPAALLLGATGGAAVCWQGAARPLAALRDRETRFRILLLGCVVLPVAAVIALQSNIYHGWRQMYFLWTPFCLLAAVGLHTLVNANAGKGRWKVAARLPGWVRGGLRSHMARRALAYGAACFGLITTLTAMAALHPHQQVYFNALVDTKTPGALAKTYDLDYGSVANRQLFEYLLDRYPDDTLRVWPRNHKRAAILPSSDRERIVFPNKDEADFYFHQPADYMLNEPRPPLFHTIQAYGNPIALIIAPNSDAYLDHYRAAYAAAANGTLLARSDFEIYIHNGKLYYLNGDCSPPESDANFVKIFLHFFPANPDDLPARSRELGFENRDSGHLVFFDGKCLNRQFLPDYPIAHIRTGQSVKGEVIWRADIDLAAHAAAQALYESVVAGGYGQPAARSDFDVYLRGKTLAYLKEPCTAGDIDARFFLHTFPADSADLPADWREQGFANLDFQFTDHGARAGDICVAERDLPGYAIERIRTGQFVSGEGRVWSVEFPVER